MTQLEQLLERSEYYLNYIITIKFKEITESYSKLSYLSKDVAEALDTVNKLKSVYFITIVSCFPKGKDVPLAKRVLFES